VISRIVLIDFAQGLVVLPQEQHIEIATYSIEKFQPRVVAFEEQVSIIRENLAAIYEEQEEWIEAAKTLIGIPLESQRFVLVSRGD
jgi:COP9 signalosome complex subunit 4